MRWQFLRRTGSESNGESNVWCKADREKENRGPMEMLGLKETAVQMVRACVEEG